MKFKLIPHAEKELAQRQISRQQLDSVLNAPQQIISEMYGRKAYQSKLDFGNGKIFLLRAIVDESTQPFTVITAYRTKKTDKYWREPT
jgi:hypothetical protein